ncbi:Trans-aconitate 2-methyltransferase [Phytophthora cinnamomi]|uniref:Trans-aconitate 2-methyltransferase n=1 Tax=Phytophthora cinnamomi TaxID=4785 RepID=UPI0035598691|nr:Trans-aconitate 2-methyltransferase [Phytophthora cinnamomi]
MAQSAIRATQTWQPQKYLKFQQQRLRPALDLLARVSSIPSAVEDSIEIIDLGAGTGNMAPAFLKRWPNAHVTFVDSATSMLEVAQQEHKENDSLRSQQFSYVQGDFETYDPGHPVDLIFSNAALQWARADQHKEIMSRLYSFLKPGGVLAFQIPDTRLQPNYHLMVQAAAELGLGERAAGVRSVTCEHDPEFYYDLFKSADKDVELDMWVTVYAHILEGDNPVADFTSSTGLRPFMKALGEPSTEAAQFEQKYRELIAAAYPKQRDGSTIFHFKRFFLTAAKPL